MVTRVELASPLASPRSEYMAADSFILFIMGPYRLSGCVLDTNNDHIRCIRILLKRNSGSRRNVFRLTSSGLFGGVIT